MNENLIKISKTSLLSPFLDALILNLEKVFQYAFPTACFEIAIEHYITLDKNLTDDWHPKYLPDAGNTRYGEIMCQSPVDPIGAQDFDDKIQPD